MKTRDRIIHTALTLFNERGEPNVTTNHIAAEMGISPGNLYYHFRNKEEIIHSIFDLYAHDLTMAFSPDKSRDHMQEGMALYLDATFSLMWRYRFFYANLPDILRRDDSLQEKYLTAQKRMKANLTAVIRQFDEAGWVAIDEASQQDMANTLKLVVSSWIFYQSAQVPGTVITKQVVYQGVLQVLAIVRPLTTELGRQNVDKLIQLYRDQMPQS
ncbi:TetR/AcrR family transcriptional regulator [Parasalinivibrio latis]|uniref:TetR/AcrR family transcriptional regulator n=1 Tax=Parasalinivibrio latis TaxID=2952610 RepID=UPI0030DFD4DD